MKIILHAGMGKCGSSALQSHLSMAKSLAGVNGKCIYAALRPKGHVLYGAKLRREAAVNPFGYISSSKARSFLNSKTAQFMLRQRLTAISRKNKTIILSNEGWTSELPMWKTQTIFDKNRDQVDIVLYIRPPAVWLNSAWWQWGAWSGQKFSVWLERHLPRVCWSNWVKEWQALPFVRQVYVRVIGEDIVQDFCREFGLDAVAPPVPVRINRSLPNGVLRLFQAHPELRPSAHAAYIDFAINQHLDLGGKPAWVLDKREVERVLYFTLRYNQDLLGLVDDETREVIINDPQWWDASRFESLQVEAPENIPPTYQELETLATQAILAIKALNSELIALKKQSMVRMALKSFWPFSLL